MPQTPPPPTVLADSLRSVRLDSFRAASDSVRAAADSLRDTTGVLARAAEDVGQASEMLVQGRWQLFASHMGQSLERMATEFLPNLVKAIVVFLLLYGLYRLVSTVAERVLTSSERVDDGLRGLLLRSLRIAAVLLITVMVLAQFGIDLTVLIGGLSIAGLAIGFAAKDTLENFISGIAILLDRPFRVGDQVVIDGTYGTVVDISLRSTRLRTLANEILVMPNFQMINQPLLNHAMLGAVRVGVPFSVAYAHRPDEARRAVLALPDTDDRIAADPPPHVVVTRLADSGVEMELRFFLTDPALEVPVRSEYLERVMNALVDADVTIPFPQLDVHFDPTAARTPPRPRAPRPAAGAPPDQSGQDAAPLVDVAGAAPDDTAADIARRLDAEGLAGPNAPARPSRRIRPRGPGRAGRDGGGAQPAS